MSRPKLFGEQKMPLLHIIPAGVQRAAALCRGAGCPHIHSFYLFCTPPQAACGEKGQQAMSQEKLQVFRTWLSEQGLDAFLLTQPLNCSYLSGWLIDEEGASSLLIGQEQRILLTNPLYTEVAGREAVGWQVIVPAAREY